MTPRSKILKWARQLTSRMPSVGPRLRRAAWRKPADEASAQSVPFLVSALAKWMNLKRSQVIHATDSGYGIRACRVSLPHLAVTALLSMNRKLAPSCRHQLMRAICGGLCPPPVAL